MQMTMLFCLNCMCSIIIGLSLHLEAKQLGPHFHLGVYVLIGFYQMELQILLTDTYYLKY